MPFEMQMQPGAQSQGAVRQAAAPPEVGVVRSVSPPRRLRLDTDPGGLRAATADGSAVGRPRNPPARYSRESTIQTSKICACHSSVYVGVAAAGQHGNLSADPAGCSLANAPVTRRKADRQGRISAHAHIRYVTAQPFHMTALLRGLHS